MQTLQGPGLTKDGHLNKEASWRIMTLATFRKIEKVNKYIEVNDNQFSIVGEEKYKYGKGRAKITKWCWIKIGITSVYS